MTLILGYEPRLVQVGWGRLLVVDSVSPVGRVDLLRFTQGLEPDPNDGVGMVGHGHAGVFWTVQAVPNAGGHVVRGADRVDSGP